MDKSKSKFNGHIKSKYFLFLFLTVCLLGFNEILVPKKYFSVHESPRDFIMEADEVALTHDPDFRSGDDKRVKISHIFNSYPTKENTLPDIESKFVFSSWYQAADYARSIGIEVDFVDVTLSREESSAPSEVLKHYLKQVVTLPQGFVNFDNIEVPFVGDILQAGIQASTGEFILFTNTDIAVKLQFYEEIVGLIHTKDIRSIVDSLYDHFRRLFSKCVGFEKISDPAVFFNSKNFKVALNDCRRDFEVIFFNQGFTNALKAKELLENMLIVFETNFLKQSINISTEEYLMFKERIQEVLQPVDKVAMTITRLDLSLREEEIKATAEADFSTAYSRIINTIPEKAKLHPGNDCFIFSKSSINSKLLELKHPIGLRPWGSYVRAIYTTQNLSWRRVVGTKNKYLTFHLGIGLWRFGENKDNWSIQAQTNPGKMLLLQSYFHTLDSGETLQKMRKKYPICSAPGSLNKYFKTAEFCDKGQTDLCRGSTRYQCIDALHDSSRDMLFAKANCRGEKLSKIFPNSVPNSVLLYCQSLST